MSSSVGMIVHNAALDHPEVPAVIDRDHSITYARLMRRVAHLAARIGEAAGPGSVIAVVAGRGIDGVVAMLATWWAGCTYMPLDASLPHLRLEQMVRAAAPDLILGDSSGMQSSGISVPTMQIGATDSQPIAPPQPAEVAYVVFTSGTTGVAKGIIMGERCLRNLVEWHLASFDSAPGIRTAQFAAVGFDVAIQEVATTLASAGTLVVIDDEQRRNPRLLLDTSDQHQIERLFLPTPALQILATEAAAYGGGSSLRDVICAGDQLRLTPDVRRWFATLPTARLHNHYGPAETHVVTSYTLNPEPETWPDRAPIGTPLPHARIECVEVDESGVGELVVWGECVAHGYLAQPELTRDRFFEQNGERGFRTGDLVQYRDGLLYFVGRRDRQIKISGYRVELDEVEAHVSQHPAVTECVVDVDDSAGDRELVAYVVTRSGMEIDRREIHRFLSGRVPHYLVPHRVHVLGKIPMTPTGKLDRHALRQAITPPPAGDAPGRHHDIEQAVLLAFEHALGHADFGRSENFFDIGGTSLRANRVRGYLSDMLDIDVPAVLLYANPTAEALIRSLSGDAALSDAPIAAADKRVERRQRQTELRQQRRSRRQS